MFEIINKDIWSCFIMNYVTCRSLARQTLIIIKIKLKCVIRELSKYDLEGELGSTSRNKCDAN